jgi:uncharacterized membrane protein YccC
MIMKKGFFALLAGAVVLTLAGCVSTVSENKTAGVKLTPDQLENRYEVTINEAFEAARRVLQSYGQLTRESNLLQATNQVRALEGKANGRDVWIRLEALQPRLTAVTVQARSTWAGSDVQTAHDVATRVALELSK